jgi:hypothetical protein
MLRKDTMDVIILDEHGNDISNELQGDLYNVCEVISAKYETIVTIKVKKEASQLASYL